MSQNQTSPTFEDRALVDPSPAETAARRLKLVSTEYDGKNDDEIVRKTFRVPQSIGELALSYPDQFPQLEDFQRITEPLFPEQQQRQRRSLVPGEVPHVENKVFPGHLALHRAGKIGAWVTTAIHGEPRARLIFARKTHAVEIPLEEDEIESNGWRTWLRD